MKDYNQLAIFELQNTNFMWFNITKCLLSTGVGAEQLLSMW